MSVSVPHAVVEEIETRLKSAVRSFSFASGGCINHGGKVTTSQGTYFLKWNDLDNFPGMFAAEAKGLSLLGETKTLTVPRVINTGEAGPFQFLLLECIQPGGKAADYWERFGSGLAGLHKTSATHFGLDHDNFIGALPQRNARCISWPEFFVQQRIIPQLQIAIDTGKTDRSLIGKFDALFRRLPSLLVNEPPSLLHGDLWSGNLMTDSTGKPCIIDPAVYYGHREMDLAMTQLFGGFDPLYFKSYEEVYPLSPGYEDRLDICNLYPLLVHVNLFGGGYASQVTSTVSRFV